MRHFITFLLILFFFSGYSQKSNAVNELINRVIPGHSKFFELKLLASRQGKSVFQIYSHQGKIVLAGNTNNEIAVAFNWYLKYYCNASTSACGNQLNLPAVLPLPKDTLSKSSPFQRRFYLNYCTFSYSMAFWDWKRWERELDWMAMNGINISLAVNGTEKVWQKTLKRFGYTDPEVKSFLCGPAFEAWWLMGNLESWGGPVSQNWIDGQFELQKKILARMEVLGIQPVVQGFYGIVPNSLIRKYQDAKIHDSGLWCSYLRPAFLFPSDPLFEKMASAYYQEMEKCYGKQTYFAGDPFHEGGVPKGVAVTLAGTLIQAQMQKGAPGSTWVLTAWQSNPRAAMLKGLDAKHTLVVDLFSEIRPHWTRKVAEDSTQNGFQHVPWIWSSLPNFGGNYGMFGPLDRIAKGIPEALESPKKGELCGIGCTPEAMGTNPVTYDLQYEMAWRHESPVMDQWLVDYQTRRYGALDNNAAAAWKILGKTVYEVKSGQERGSESVLCARPDLDPKTASSWGSLTLFYNPVELARALELMLKAADRFSGSDAFGYDLADITRQVLSNYSVEKIKRVRQAFEQKDMDRFTRESKEFLDLMRDQEMILATRKEFLLGSWIEAARNKGTNKAEKDLYEWNARTQVTVWGNRAGSEVGGLHDYANKEWSGLMSDFYLPRWEMFFNELANQLKGLPKANIDYFAWEEHWTHQLNVYPSEPKGNTIQMANLLFLKYKADIIKY